MSIVEVGLRGGTGAILLLVAALLVRHRLAKMRVA